LLFENEEMRRHFVRHGMRVHYARDFLIARRPPTFAKWREQRVRQAYEDLDARVKTAAFAALLPVGAVIATFGAVAVLAYAAVVSSWWSCSPCWVAAMARAVSCRCAHAC
jgi:hypothetical protein